MGSLTRWVLAHKRTVVLGWIVLTIAGMMAAGPATDALENEFTVPDKDAWETNERLQAMTGTGGDSSPLFAVATAPEGETLTGKDARNELGAVDAAVRDALPGARVASYASTGSDAFVSDDGSTAFTIIYPQPDPNAAFGENPQAAKDAAEAVSALSVSGNAVHLTGFDALYEDSGADSEGPGLLLEALIGGTGALLVLLFVFASALAIVPIFMAIASIMTSFLLLFVLTEVATISPIVQFLIALLGLGIAIDYSLLVVTRWREERDKGHSGDEAVERAMATAGRAVVFSGITVAIGLLALIALPLPFLRSMGYGGMLIPLVSTLAAITLLPVVLAKVGQRLDWPHRHRDDTASRSWTRWAETISRRRWLAAGIGMAIVVALVVAATDMRMGLGDADTIASSGDSHDGLVALEESGIGEGVLFPHEILIDPGGPDASELAARVSEVPGMHGAVAPDDESWRPEGHAIVEAFTVGDSASDEAQDSLGVLRGVVGDAGATVHLGGQPAANEEFTDAVYGSFPLMIALIAITTFILLARAFRSLLLPAKAIVLNVLSVAAAWGVMVLIWQHGYGSEAIWGIEATGSIASWMPLMVFAFLFGLSMDYEVFILTRMREEYDRTGSTHAAVVEGIGRTGRLVTSAALILFLAFISMAASPGTDIKIFATGLGAGILLDATVIRALIVPAVISLMGRWNWWLPRAPAKLLRVEPSKLQAAEARP